MSDGAGAPTTDPQVAWHAANVTLGAVLEALTSIRNRFAREEAAAEEQPHPRNCVMTLIAVASSDAEERRGQLAYRMIGAQHPVQGIVIREQSDAPTSGLEASILIDVQRSPGVCATQCELVTMRVHGAAGQHLAGLIDPLTTSGVPTILWWVGTPPFGTRELDEALKISDALVVDSSRFGRPYHSFLGLNRIAANRHQHFGLGDIQWSRLRPWRETIAQFFGPVERRSFLAGISSVGIDYAGEGRGNRIGAALLTGWIASALNWKLHRAASGAGGVVAAHYTGEEGWRPIDVAFRSVPKANLEPGEISAVRIEGASGGQSFSLSAQRDPVRAPRREPPDPSYSSVHRPGGEDDAGVELAERRSEWHRDVLQGSRDALHHTATGQPPGEGTPRTPIVVTRERRKGEDPSLILLTLIRIGAGETLRHIQRIGSEDDATLLLDLLANGTHDSVYIRSLTAASELMQAV